MCQVAHVNFPEKNLLEETDGVLALKLERYIYEHDDITSDGARSTHSLRS